MDQTELQKLLNDPTREARLLAFDVSNPMILLGQAGGSRSATSAILKIEVLVRDGSGQKVEVAILPIAMSRTQCTELGDTLKRLAIMEHRPHSVAN